jgi:hypothetical protein
MLPRRWPRLSFIKSARSVRVWLSRHLQFDVCALLHVLSNLQFSATGSLRPMVYARAA